MDVEDASVKTLQEWISDWGLSREWTREEREAVREAHDGLLEEWKREHSNGSRSIADIPGLLPSVQRLLDQGYCISDIGDMLGITRERVRQWCEEHDLDRSNAPNGSAFRVWDPGLGRFRAATTEEVGRRIGRAKKRQAEKGRAEVVHGRLREDIQALRDVAREHDLPTLNRMERVRGKHYQTVLRRWADIHGEESYAVGADRLYRTAGVRQPEQGAWERGAQDVGSRDDAFAQMITEDRLARGWTQEELAEQVGVSRVSVWRWEHGHVPSDENAARLGEALGWGE